MKIQELEEKIMSAWNTSDDIKLLMRQLFDAEESMSEDDIMNTMIGIIYLHDMRCAEMLETYEQCVKQFYNERAADKEI